MNKQAPKKPIRIGPFKLTFYRDMLGLFVIGLLLFLGIRNFKSIVGFFTHPSTEEPAAVALATSTPAKVVKTNNPSTKPAAAASATPFLPAMSSPTAEAAIATEEVKSTVVGKNCDGKVIITDALDTFGPYLTHLLQAAMMDGSESYCLNLVLFNFTVKEGDKEVVLNDTPEEKRVQNMKDGTWDMWSSTLDAPGRFGTDFGRLWFVYGNSDGADVVDALKAIVFNPKDPNHPKINDLNKKLVAASANSVGENYLIASAQLTGLKVKYVTPDQLGTEQREDGYVTIVEVDTVTDVVNLLNDKKVDAGAGWMPDMGDAENESTFQLISSKWWKLAWDGIYISNKANTEKETVMFEVTEDFGRALKLMQDDRKKAAELIAGYLYKGLPTNEWSFIGCKDCEGTLQEQLEASLKDYSQANVSANSLLFDKKSVTLVQLMNMHRGIWAYGGKSNLNSVFDPAAMLEPKYIERMAKDPSLQATGRFVNSNFQAVVQNVPDESANLVDIPVVDLPCQHFQFERNSPALTDEDITVLQACAAPMIEMLRFSHGHIEIIGSAANAVGYTYEQAWNTASGRADSVITVLTNMNVPTSQMTKTVSVPQDKQATESAQYDYRTVIVRYVRQGGT
jgi:hypothetical protein